MKKILIFILVAFVFQACNVNCDSSKSDRRKSSGAPEEVTSYSSGNYSTETWWYWSKGISYTFTWGTDGCKTSSYSFSPMHKIEHIDIDSLTQIMKLQSVEFEKDCITCP